MDLKTKDVVIDKALVTWHIIAYFFVALAFFFQLYFFPENLSSYAISTYCLQAINLVCSTILAAIVNKILTIYLRTSPNNSSFISDAHSSHSSLTQSYVKTDVRLGSLILVSSRSSEENIELLVED